MCIGNDSAGLLSPPLCLCVCATVCVCVCVPHDLSAFFNYSAGSLAWVPNNSRVCASLSPRWITPITRKRCQGNCVNHGDIVSNVQGRDWKSFLRARRVPSAELHVKRTCLTPLSADLLRFFRGALCPEDERHSSIWGDKRALALLSLSRWRGMSRRRSRGGDGSLPRRRPTRTHTQTNHHSAGIEAEVKHLFFCLVRQNFHFLQTYFPRLSWKLVFLKRTTIKE